MFRISLFLLNLLVASSIASADVITIQPIRVTLSDGSGGPTVNLFAAETQKIYAQAGHTVNFLTTSTFMSDTYVDLAVGEFTPLATGAGHGQHADPNVINMFFVNTIASSGGGTTFGVGFLGGNGVAIAADSVNAFNGGIGRLDTIAHEIGHNLGLDHDNLGAGVAENVMTSGSIRTVPSSIMDITPTGAGLSVFSRDQVTEMAKSSFLVAVPEPSSMLLFAAVAVGCMRRRRSI